MTRRFTVRSHLGLSVVGVALATLTGCGDLLVDGRTLRIESTGTVEGVVFLDANGNGNIEGGDPHYPNLRIQLLTADGVSVVDTATTNSSGQFRFPTAPVGDLRLAADPLSLSDSLVVRDLSDELFTVEPGRTVPVVFSVSFPAYQLQDVRNSVLPGQSIFTTGIVLNQRNQPGDAVVHIRDGNTYLRLTQVALVGLEVGDSVRVRGRTAVSAGQPILTDAAIFQLVPRVTLVFPVAVTSGAATTAMGGTLDAALVRIQNAAITNTQVVQGVTGPYLHVTADDGSGPVVVVLRNFINFNLGQINPGTSQFTSATGLLVPVQDGAGNVTWQMTPRADSDLDVDQIGGG